MDPVSHGIMAIIDRITPIIPNFFTDEQKTKSMGLAAQRSRRITGCARLMRSCKEKFIHV
jgi:hypothetical protein